MTNYQKKLEKYSRKIAEVDFWIDQGYTKWTALNYAKVSDTTYSNWKKRIKKERKVEV